MEEQGALSDTILVSARRWEALRVAGPAFDYVAVHVLLVPAVLGLLALLLQYSSLDFAIATFASDATTHTFAWRNSAWLDVLGHQSARGLPILVGTLAATAGMAGYVVARLQPWRQILVTIGAAMAAGPLLIAFMKSATTLHCPASLQEFGGIVSYALDRSAPFWASSPYRAGHCSPSGHAGGGYALFALYFAGWTAGRPLWRWAGLAIGVAAGLVFSAVRIMQGAHFASATLWSAVVDWEVCALFFLPLLCQRFRSAS
jgi:membrane-associated PAP2 superfamily phosphatase